jgi:aarF domain-containing kinase
MLVRRNPDSWNNALELVILDHGLYQQIDDEFRVEYARLWISIVERDEDAVRDIAKSLGVQSYDILASMLTARAWREEKAGMSTRLSESDRARLMNLAQDSFGRITQVLSEVNRKVLLLLKCNDLLRSVQMDLGVPVNYFVLFARYAMQGINRNRIAKNPTLWTYLSCLRDYTILSWKMRIFEWLSALQRAYDQFVGTLQKGFTISRQVRNHTA